MDMMIGQVADRPTYYYIGFHVVVVAILGVLVFKDVISLLAAFIIEVIAVWISYRAIKDTAPPPQVPDGANWIVIKGDYFAVYESKPRAANGFTYVPLDLKTRKTSAYYTIPSRGGNYLETNLVVTWKPDPSDMWYFYNHRDGMDEQVRTAVLEDVCAWSRSLPREDIFNGDFTPKTYPGVIVERVSLLDVNDTSEIRLTIPNDFKAELDAISVHFTTMAQAEALKAVLLAKATSPQEEGFIKVYIENLVNKLSSEALK